MLERNQLESYREAYLTEGYCVIPSLLNASQVEQIAERFEQIWRDGVPGFLERDEQGQINWLKERYPRIVHPHRFDDLSKKLLLNPDLLSVVEACLSDEPLGAQTMYYWKHPGSLGQALHQDNLYLQASDAAGCMAAWIAIDPADEENGCMHVVPGSHQLEIICPEKADASEYYFSDYVAPPEGLTPIPVPMSPGDVLFFGGRTIHGSNPNRSKTRSRRSFICHYIGARSTQSAGFYNPLIRRDGTEFNNEESDGGPCGVFVSAPH